MFLYFYSSKKVTIQLTENISAAQLSALKTLCYFDVFHYPLNALDIVSFSENKISIEELNALTDLGIIKEESGFYFLSSSKASVANRVAGNKRAHKLENKAIRKAKFIGKFPFVRSVSLSGSMSKGYMDEEADLDFFIVTKPGRLWIARTFLIFYKKAFLLNSRKYFCVNYFVDTNHLEIEEKNRFTATEVVTLRNIYGNRVHQDFLNSNEWASNHFPWHEANGIQTELRNPFFKRTLEKMLNGKMGDKLDQRFMNMTLKRWDKKFGTMEQGDFDLAFKSRTYVSKHHPSNFQKKVLDAMEERIIALESNHQIKLR